MIIHPSESNWESLSREALRDDLDLQQRQLTAGLIGFNGKHKDLQDQFESWGAAHPALLERWRQMLADLKSAPGLNYTMFFVAIRELLDLTQTTFQSYVNVTEVS